jgi:hypothetical protein
MGNGRIDVQSSLRCLRIKGALASREFGGKEGFLKKK